MAWRLPFLNPAPRVAVIRLNGAIASGGGGRTLNDAGTAQMIERAFSNGKPKAVALVINSPGGSPVQSSLIAARIRRLAEEKNVKVYAFVEDVAASGGYWLACAAYEIWVDATSLVGSIGLIYAGFGFQDLISRYGIERRVHTAGGSKSKLDPFRPENPEDIAKLKEWQAQIHQVFIDHVSKARGARLNSDNPDLFTGEIWVGAKAVEEGLADGVGHLVPKMKQLFGEKVSLKVYGPKRGLFRRLGSEMAQEAPGLAEERSLYARYGL